MYPYIRKHRRNDKLALFNEVKFSHLIHPQEFVPVISQVRITINKLSTSSSAPERTGISSNSTTADCILSFCWVVKVSEHDKGCCHITLTKVTGYLNQIEEIHFALRMGNKTEEEKNETTLPRNLQI